jgi:predicted phage terminase large subunit-like protein
MATALIRGRTETDILAIEAPPRHGKSELFSKWTPAWHILRWPEKRVIIASYEHNFARMWGRKVREIIEEHGAEFGVTISDGQSAASDWETNYGGGMLTAGARGPMTGRGADLLIIDDPIKNAEEAVSEVVRDGLGDWWDSTASTRIEPGGKAILIATRWHEDDLTGRVLRHADERGGRKIQQLTLRAVAEDDDVLGREEGEALWPQRYDEKALERERLSRDAYWWLSLYQQRPGRPGVTEWPEEYFGPHIWADRWPDAFEAVSQGIDPSKGKNSKRGDYSAIVTACLSGDLLWIDASIERRPTERIVADAVSLAMVSRPHVVSIESNGFQEEVAATFERAAWNAGLVGMPVRYVENTGNKELRLQWNLGPHLAKKRLRFRNTPGCRLLVQQLREFPLGKHDDGPDALEMAIGGLNALGAPTELEVERAMI